MVFRLLSFFFFPFFPFESLYPLDILVLRYLHESEGFFATNSSESVLFFFFFFCIGDVGELVERIRQCIEDNDDDDDDDDDFN